MFQYISRSPKVQVLDFANRQRAQYLGSELERSEFGNRCKAQSHAAEVSWVQEGTPDFKRQGWSNGGKNKNPTKSLEQDLTPKKSHAEFPSHKKFQKALNDITRKIDRNMSFEYPKIPT